MKLTLFTNDRIITEFLPEKCAGHYWIHREDASGRLNQVIAVEAERIQKNAAEAKWVIKSNNKYAIYVPSSDAEFEKAEITAGSLYTIREKKTGVIYKLFCEPLTDDRSMYRAYEFVSKPFEIKIGSTYDCAVQYNNQYTSRQHATIGVYGDRLTITDNASSNGTYVNNRVLPGSTETILHPGDLIYIMGMQIIVMPDYLFINDPDNTVRISGSHLRLHHQLPYIPQTSEPDYEEPEDYDTFYYRAPRDNSRKVLPDYKFKIDPPPAPKQNDGAPVLLSIGPSLTMGMASATTAAFSVVNALNSGNINSAIPSIVMSVSMLSGTLMWPIITKSYQKKLNARAEEERITRYSDHLRTMDGLISEAMAEQENILRANNVSVEVNYDRLNQEPLVIWERSPRHTDFLSVRLGIGSTPFAADISYPEKHFSVNADRLLNAAHAIGSKKRYLNDIPICLDLKERYVTGIYASNADHRRLIEFAQSLILQLTLQHSYDEMKLVFLYDRSDEGAMSFARWLPHSMNNEQSVRYIATDPEELKELSADLDPIVEYRAGLNADKLEAETTHYVVVCLDKRLFEKADFLRKILKSKTYMGFSVVSLFDKRNHLPKECSAIISIEDSGMSSLTHVEDTGSEPIPFTPDAFDGKWMFKATDVLANTYLDIADTTFKLPKSYSFFEMLDVGMVEHINLQENWAASDPTKSLAAPIGIDPYGEPFILDIHERAHGPHGLIAGTTGSGKSQTIISYILSMALKFDPNEVAFILIDYKGGGMAEPFARLPHTLGIITNLDGNLINRSLVSLNSELHRRERIFHETEKTLGVNNVDIYAYQKLFREGKVSEALPHLVIISDEFAELKKDQPDFMEALTSAARVGRSLGVHLILATQKPGGVVDDQIRSNSRFRLCLKVQDTGDSTEMMGRPEAAFIKETGRFYLQVGNNELFKLGQSAWAGATYIPAPETIKDKADSITVINTNGRVLAEVNTERYAKSADSVSQLKAVTDYVCKVCDEMAEAAGADMWRRQKLWLDPIPDKIYIDKLSEKYAVKKSRFRLDPIVGEYDDPEHQSQGLLTVPLSDEGNVLIYGAAGSGKSNFLETVCYSLLNEHSPSEVNLYIVDLGTESLTEFADAPHVGDVILASDAEKVENLFKLLYGKIKARKKLMAEYGGSFEHYNAEAAVPEPNIVVMINNFSNFSELYEDHLADINYLTREGTRYGVYFMLTSTSVTGVRFNLMQNFKLMYCLQLNNEADYSTIVGKHGKLYPQEHLGRGLVRLNNSVVEFQTARVTTSNVAYSFIREFCSGLAAKYSSHTTAKVPTLPEKVTLSHIAGNIDPDDLQHIPIGIEKESLETAYLDISDKPLYMILSKGAEWSNFAERLAVLLADSYNAEVKLLAPSGTVVSGSSEKLSVCGDAESAADSIFDVYKALLERHRACKAAEQSGEALPAFRPIFVVCKSVSDITAKCASLTYTDPAAGGSYGINEFFNITVGTCMPKHSIYFIVADSDSELVKYRYSAWCKQKFDGSNGMWIGSGIDSQYYLTVSNRPNGYRSALEKNFGFIVKNEEAVLVKLLE